MEGFSSLFEAVIQEKPFYYHPRCCSLGISHIIFAHDLFVLAGATPRYLTAIKADLVWVWRIIRLRPNLQKSNLFFAGVDEAERGQLCDILGIQEGWLPLRYLGLPLISTKLDAAAHKNFLDEMMSKIKSWSTKTLSYAGRVQLIKSVLSSVKM